MSLTPLDELPITMRRDGRTWPALAASVLSHGGLIALILLLTRPPKRDAESDPAAAAAEPPTEQQMVYLTPPSVPKPLPKPAPQPVERVPRQQDRIPLPQVTRGPENIPETPPTPTPTPAPADPVPAQPPGMPSSAPAGPPAVADAAAAASAAFDADTRRLFGRHEVTAASSGATPIIRWNNGPTEQRDNDCRPRPIPPRPAGTPITLEYVQGIVYNDATHVPLAGAYLQIMGTQYVTFADDAGHYRLGFDPALVDECRSQYVRVIARGVAPQLIVLGRGYGGTNIYLRP